MSSNPPHLDRVAAGLTTPRHRRATLRMIRRAVRDGWHLTPELCEMLPHLTHDATQQASKDGDGRAVVHGARAVMEMVTHNLQLAKIADKAQRLDECDMTENVIFRLIKFREDGNIETPNGSHSGMEPSE